MIFSDATRHDKQRTYDHSRHVECEKNENEIGPECLFFTLFSAEMGKCTVQSRDRTNVSAVNAGYAEDTGILL